MVIVDHCKWGVFQLNGGGYNSRGGRKHHFHSPESAT
jgi:hypothetical protein